MKWNETDLLHFPHLTTLNPTISTIAISNIIKLYWQMICAVRPGGITSNRCHRSWLPQINGLGIGMSAPCEALHFSLQEIPRQIVCLILGTSRAGLTKFTQFCHVGPKKLPVKVSLSFPNQASTTGDASPKRPGWRQSRVAPPPSHETRLLDPVYFGMESWGDGRMGMANVPPSVPSI